MRARLLVPVFLVVVATAAIAGCGSSGSSSSSSTSASGGAAGTSGSATVDVSSNAQLGQILVDAQGRTLYTFQKDTGGRSSCTGMCATIWPPLVAKGKPTAANGASSSMLGTTKRSDGSTQVTYGGHPLYTYTADKAAGDVTGNGVNSFGGVWNAVQPSGAKAPSGSGGASASSSSSSTSSGGYGY